MGKRAQKEVAVNFVTLCRLIYIGQDYHIVSHINLCSAGSYLIRRWYIGCSPSTANESQCCVVAERGQVGRMMLLVVVQRGWLVCCVWRYACKTLVSRDNKNQQELQYGKVSHSLFAAGGRSIVSRCVLYTT